MMMFSNSEKNEAEARQISLQLLNNIFSNKISSQVGIRLWDGTRWPDSTEQKSATLVLKHPGALRSMFLPGNELGLAEAYLYEDFDVEGSVEAAFELANILDELTLGWNRKLKVTTDLIHLPVNRNNSSRKRNPAELGGTYHSVERDRKAVTYHYDVSNDFYRLWLDRRMVYSCAYFDSSEDELDAAQEKKLDYICRKLRLMPGQKLLDIGCGWGGLAIHAAKNYGVKVTGITLSQPQAELANPQVAEAGLQDQVTILVKDYRKVKVEKPDFFDALVSVGMFEHVGKEMLLGYFSHAYELLKPGGVFLNHGIASIATEKPKKGPTFIDSYVFPDGELVPIYMTIKTAEEAGFEVRDVESLREHYALTLRHWVKRLEANHDKVLRYVDEATYRVWRLYMSGAAYNFRHGRINVYQTLLVKPDEQGNSNLPLTRNDLYRYE